MDDQRKVQTLLAQHDKHYRNLSDLWESLMHIAKSTPHKQTVSLIRNSANSLEYELRKMEAERETIEKKEVEPGA